ncbi:uncharacterized protein [Anabrus simplex]|uniref:uncharacterized protein n=1 Tax=Anabrus simplex TaxID=316456 RepID=UPI0035A36180
MTRTTLLLLLVMEAMMHANAIVTSPEQASLCDSSICTCPPTSWGNVTCQCVGSQQEVIVRSRGHLHVPSHLTLLRVVDCEHVLVMEDALHDLRFLQKVELRRIRRLEVAPRAFSRPLESDGEVPSTVPEVKIEESYIPELPSYAFRGYLRAIRLRDVRVDTIAAFAFASLSSLEHIELRDCTLNTVNAQAFKKFVVRKLSFVGTSIVKALPSRAVTDLEVISEVRFERVSAVRLHSSSLLVRGPHTVHITACNISHMEGEALRISTQGAVVIQDNIFPSVDPGAFLGFSVERYTLREKGRQEFVFHNNTLHSFKAGALSFNETSFEARIEKVTVSRLCMCDILELWLSQLKVTVDEVLCLDSTTKQLIEANEAGCGSLHGWSGTLVLVVTICGGLLVLGIALIALCCWRRRQRTRGKRWVTVPNKNKVKNPGNAHTMGIVLPDGRTYRETELHVIVERAEPIDDKD